MNRAQYHELRRAAYRLNFGNGSSNDIGYCASEAQNNIAMARSIRARICPPLDQTEAARERRLAGLQRRLWLHMNPPPRNARPWSMWP